jgi:hypothetical protein
MLIVPADLSLATYALPGGTVGSHQRSACKDESAANRLFHRSGAAFTGEDARASRSDRTMLRRAYLSLLKFSALPASQRCVFAVKSWMDRCPVL